MHLASPLVEGKKVLQNFNEPRKVQISRYPVKMYANLRGQKKSFASST